MVKVALSMPERRVVGAVQSSPEASQKQLAQLLRMKEASVGYYLRTLTERGILRRRLFVNCCRLGYLDVGLFFSLVDVERMTLRSLLTRIEHHDRVSYFGSLLGDYHYVVVFLVRTLSEIPAVLQSLFAGTEDLFADKLIAPRSFVWMFPRKYFGPFTEQPYVLPIESGHGEYETDLLDRQILNELGNAPFESLRHLARQVGAPVSTVERRVESLRGRGVIVRSFYEVAVDRLGLVAYRLLLSKKGVHPEAGRRVEEFARDHPLCTYLIRSVGAWDFELGIESDSPQRVTDFVEELYGLCQVRVNWIKVLQEVRDIKCSYFPLPV